MAGLGDAPPGGKKPNGRWRVPSTGEDRPLRDERPTMRFFQSEGLRAANLGLLRDRRPFPVDAEARLAGFVATEVVTRRGPRTGEASALRQEAAVVEPRRDPMPTVDLNVLRLIHRSPPSLGRNLARRLASRSARSRRHDVWAACQSTQQQATVGTSRTPAKRPSSRNGPRAPGAESGARVNARPSADASGSRTTGTPLPVLRRGQRGSRRWPEWRRPRSRRVWRARSSR